MDIAFLEDEEVKEAIRRGLKFDNKARDSLAGFGIGTSLAFAGWRVRKLYEKRRDEKARVDVKQGKIKGSRQV